MPIIYRRGDLFAAARPPGVTRLVAHVVNDVGGWGAGFTRAVSRFSPIPEQRYRAWANDPHRISFKLGHVQPVHTEDPETIVINLLAQHGYSRPHHPAIQYDALRLCLRKVRHVYERTTATRKAEIVMPRIGCGLAGGQWSVVSDLIADELAGIPVTVYDLA